MENSKIPSPAAVAARVKPKTVQQRKGWHAANPVTLEVGDLVRLRLGGHGPTYRVEKVDGDTVRLSVYSTVGVGKVPSRTIDTSTTIYVWKWF